MELYATNLFKLVCPIAATAPNNIEAIDKKIKIVCHSSIKFKKGTYKNLIKTDKAAILGTIVKNNVTEVGDPSYTSGAHIWNGTAEILNAKPTSMKTMPNVKAYSFEFSLEAIKSKLVDPVKPYINEHPYNNKPEDKALKTKYFNPASEDLILSLLKVAKTYNANDCNSRPI